MGQERELDAFAADAIAASEMEIFADAMGAPEPDTDGDGDTSLETMGEGLEGQHEPVEAEESDDEGDSKEPQAKAEGDKPADGKDRGEDGRFKPKGEERQARQETPAEKGLRTELTSEREKRRAVEDEAKRTNAEWERRFAALEARLQQQPTKPAEAKPEPAKEEVPDRWSDPEGWDHYQEQRILRQVEARDRQREQQRVAWSFEEAKAKHGDDFAKAYQAANSLPADTPAGKQVLDFVFQSQNPGQALIDWHRRVTAAREIGSDPVAFRDKAMADARDSLMKDPEFRKQMLAELQGEARNAGGGPRTRTELPPSLSSARGGSVSRAFSGSSDGELFDEVMSQ